MTDEKKARVKEGESTLGSWFRDAKNCHDKASLSRLHRLWGKFDAPVTANRLSK